VTEVERFFEYMCIPEDCKVKLVAYKFKGGLEEPLPSGSNHNKLFDKIIYSNNLIFTFFFFFFFFFFFLRLTISQKYQQRS